MVKSGFRHWFTVAAIAAPVGYPVRLFVTDAVQVTVLAPPRPEALHWVIPVTGFTELVVVEIPHTTGAVQAMSVVIVASPVGSAGVAALYVKLLTTVIVQVIVLPPTVPALLHSESPMPWALAWLAPPTAIVRPNATVKQKERRFPSETMRIFERGALLWVVTELLSVVRSGSATGSSTLRATLSPSCHQAPKRLERRLVVIPYVGTRPPPLELFPTLSDFRHCPTSSPSPRRSGYGACQRTRCISTAVQRSALANGLPMKETTPPANAS